MGAGTLVTLATVAALGSSVPDAAPGTTAKGGDAQISTQETSATTKAHVVRNSFYVEILGPGLLYSVNYDCVLGPFAARIGLMYMPPFSAIPVTLSYLVGSGRDMLELGVGLTYMPVVAYDCLNSNESSCSSESETLFGPLLGYRLEPVVGGLFFHAGVALFISHNSEIRDLEIENMLGGGWDGHVLPYVGVGGTFSL